MYMRIRQNGSSNQLISYDPNLFPTTEWKMRHPFDVNRTATPVMLTLTRMFCSGQREDSRMTRKVKFWAKFANNLSKFGQICFVFGYIGTEFCKLMRVLQHFLRFTTLST